MDRAVVAASRRRLRRLQAILRERRLGAYLAVNPAEVVYLSGFPGEDSWLLVPARGRASLITDFRYAEDAANCCPHVRRRLRKDSLAAETAAAVQGLRGRLGYHPGHMTVAARRQLGRLLRAGGRKRAGGLAELPDAVSAMRLVKDRTEIGAIRRALRIAERAWGEFLGRLRLGMTETELAAELDYALRRNGAEGPAFPTICAVGANASRPHARPGRRRLKAGDVLLVDFGAVYRGYRCDLTRMVLPARIRPAVRRAYEAVLEAQAAAIKAARPGARAVEVDAAARGVLARQGYSRAFGHGTGHGLGLEVHEGPGLSPKGGNTVLKPGMVVTIEPGVYFPGRFGIRIEDNVLITGKGSTVLSRLPKQIDQVRRSSRR